MFKHNPEERDYLLEIARFIIENVAPEELALFSELVEEYFADPTPPEPLARDANDPLAAGLDEFLAAATPAALAMVTTALNYIQTSADGPVGERSVATPNFIREVLHSQEQRVEVHRRTYETAIAYLMPPDTAQQMASTLVTALIGDTVAVERVINAWIANHIPTVPLQLHQTYQLNFNVDVPRSDAVATAGGIEELADTLPEDHCIEVSILLDTEDFNIHAPDNRILRIPASGSSNDVGFTIEPHHAGVAVITALFTINNRTFQRIRLTFQVDASTQSTPITAMATQATGLTIDSALQYPTERQAINLTIIKREAGYQFILQGASGTVRAFVNISETQIAELIATARKTLRSIVHTIANGQRVYQLQETTIPVDLHTQSLNTLAQLGTYLYTKLFYGGNGPDARMMGDLLRKLTQTHHFNIEIIAERFVFLWAILYDRENSDTVTPEGFWGFKHVIACLPEFSQTTLIRFSPYIEAGNTVNLGYVCNTCIDQQVRQPIVQQQRDFLQSMPGVVVHDYPDKASLLELLRNTQSLEHVLYFYCHAQSNLPGEPGGVGQSRLICSDDEVTLMELDMHAPTSLPPLVQAPLVFLNACESAELSPYLYDGFIPYLIARGVRGVIGTEVDTPIFFGAEFAQELLKQFLAGEQSLGETLLRLRRYYLEEKNNVLGLLYALYSSGELVIRRTQGNE
jgi:hypothetical protein